MSIDIKILARQIRPETTVLLLGAGASVPSGAPTSETLRNQLGQEFQIENYENFNLSDLATIIEVKTDRHQLVKSVRNRISRLQPTGGILSLPLFSWSGVFTTNYDNLVEKAFKKHKKSLRVISSNYDFHGAGITEEQELFKLHGTVEKDICEGSNSRLILTSSDYDQVTAYREALYGRLKDMLFTKSVLIVGQSLTDQDLKSLVDEAQKIKSTSGAPGRIFLFIFEKDENLAMIAQARGLTVCFGSIDDLFLELRKSAPTEQSVISVTADVLSAAPLLEPATLTVQTELTNQTEYLEQMFSGRAASFADIKHGWAFDREVSDELEAQHIDPERLPISVVLGVAGVGKTTAVRIALSRLSARGIECWEHKTDFSFEPLKWIEINDELIRRKKLGVLFVDDAHQFLHKINQLIETLAAQNIWALRIIIASSPPHWNPRLKSPELFKNRQEYKLSNLSLAEINHLLDLLDSSREIRELVENRFLGFSRQQRLERLKEHCHADMFVCMKNIFGFQGIDKIILKEFASLEIELQEIYRVVAGMQAIGTRVHRELVRRLTGLEANNVSRIIDDLSGIIEEYTVSEKHGIYRWCVRHQLIADTLLKYKYSNQEKLYELFERVLKTINPSYLIEVQSVIDLCDLEFGITRITNEQKQNILLRHMISIVPRLRVPRHRLIHNLIELHQFDIAATEIKIFEKDFRIDGPVLRYKIRLKLGIAKHTEEIQNEDRASLISEASAMALKCLKDFPDDKNMYRVYLETGTEEFRYTKKSKVFENAIQAARDAQQRLLDPDLRQIISKYTRIGERMGVQVYD